MKNILNVLATLAVLLSGAAGFFSVLAYERVHKGEVVNCEEIEVVKTGLRETIEQEAKFTNTSRVRTTLEKTKAETAYNEILARFKARKCTEHFTIKPKGTNAPKLPRKTH